MEFFILLIINKFLIIDLNPEFVGTIENFSYNQFSQECGIKMKNGDGWNWMEAKRIWIFNTQKSGNKGGGKGWLADVGGWTKFITIFMKIMRDQEMVPKFLIDAKIGFFAKIKRLNLEFVYGGYMDDPVGFFFWFSIFWTWNF